MPTFPDYEGAIFRIDRLVRLSYDESSEMKHYDNSPTPTPDMIRPIIMTAMLHAHVCNSPPTTNINAPYQMVLRRPIISPIRPTASDETTSVLKSRSVQNAP